MAKPKQHTILDIQVSVATLTLLVDHMLTWHFESSNNPLEECRLFRKATGKRLQSGALPTVDPVLSDAVVQMIAERVDGHLSRVHQRLEMTQSKGNQ